MGGGYEYYDIDVGYVDTVFVKSERGENLFSIPKF